MGKGRAFLRVSALVLALAWGVSGCAGQAAPAPDPDLNLARYLGAARDAQAFPLAGLYLPPPEAQRAGFVQLLSDTPAMLDLARNVTAYAAWSRGLAVGHADGSLTVVGPEGCPPPPPAPGSGVAAPAPAANDANAPSAWEAAAAASSASPRLSEAIKEAAEGDAVETPPARPGFPILAGPIRAVAYSPYSPWLLAVDGQSRAHRLDVRDCELTETYDLGRAVRDVAVSEGGVAYALLDAAGTLWTGRPGDRPRLALEHAGPCVGMGFTPAGAILALVRADGGVLLYNAATNTEMERLAVPEGPFATARVEERYLALTRPDGSHAAYDLAARRSVPFFRQLAQYRIDPDGVLRYRTWNPVLHTTAVPLSAATPDGLPAPRVDYSAALGLLRVTDVDGVVRYYSATSGLPRPDATTRDWRSVRLDPLTRFRIGSRAYALADVAFQWDHDQLLCRWIPDLGYYLWWRHVERPAEYSPLPDHLPRRDSLLLTATPVWWPLAPPKDFP